MLELEHRFPIVDCHLEIEPDESQRPRDIGDPEQVRREMQQAGIVQALAFPTTHDGDYVSANNAVARLAVERPFVAAARVTGSRAPGTGPTTRLRNAARSRTGEHTSPEEIEQYAYKNRFAAFVVDPAVDGLPDEDVLAALDDVGLPVLTHGGRDCPPAVLEQTFLNYGFPLVVAHCGGYPLDEELTHQTIDLLDSYENCFVDTSFVCFRDPLERAVMEHPDRVLVGSGAPATHPNVAVMEILTLDVPEDAMRRVFSKNPARVVDELGE
jgi:predicted TIM-barrel fold metal-dependent hydrolase